MGRLVPSTINTCVVAVKQQSGGGVIVVVLVVVVVVVVLVVVVAVVVTGDAAACAGTTTDLTTGLTHCSGTTNAPNEPPLRPACRMRLRSCSAPEISTAYTRTGSRARLLINV